MTIAVATDHRAIVVAQRKLNGFGGIGRGIHLNNLFRTTYDFLKENIVVKFFHVLGTLNTADSLSRNFGALADGNIAINRVPDFGTIPLSQMYTPLANITLATTGVYAPLPSSHK